MMWFLISLYGNLRQFARSSHWLRLYVKCLLAYVDHASNLVSLYKRLLTLAIPCTSSNKHACSPHTVHC